MFRPEILRTIDIGELAYDYKVSLQQEEYEWCATLKAEVERRRQTGEFDVYWAITTYRQPGLNWEVCYDGLNGLFDFLREEHPEEFTPEAALLYGVKLSLQCADAGWRQ